MLCRKGRPGAGQDVMQNKSIPGAVICAAVSRRKMFRVSPTVCIRGMRVLRS